MAENPKISFSDQPEQGMPAEAHDAHMDEMMAGLQQILQSQDINEIHSIAQGLLGQEEQEAQMEGNPAADYSAGMDKILGS